MASNPSGLPLRATPWELETGPPPEHWDDWVELDSAAWPRQVERHYRCIPTICFNCESACGLLAFVDKQTGEIEKFEGNPVHPGSRGRTCAKGPATLNQVRDTERILKPLRRVGRRGEGRFEEVSWKEALRDIGSRIGNAIREGRQDEVMYHVGRPGEDSFVMRMLQAWGTDAHNSHTNVCSASARLGFALTCGSDRPSPDYSKTDFFLLLSAHLETGHYFNPHAQRIVEAMERGARAAVIDTRLSNTASRATHWISTWPGSEAALLLGVAHELLKRDAVDREYVERWTNWEEALGVMDPSGPKDLDRFLKLLQKRYERFTPEYVAEECRCSPDAVKLLADEIQRAGSRFASHLWRNAASGNLGGWQIARALLLLHILSGSLGRPGGLNPNSWDKFVPKPTAMPPARHGWNELLWPKEWPLAHYEMSFLLPHLLHEQDKKIDVYFTRVYNPVWTNPDGCSWIEMLENEERVGCHVALTPIWSETAQWADYVLPMGLAPERHDIMSQETHAGTWIGFRQPVQREFERKERGGDGRTLGSNPGEVWEEAEFWTELAFHIDPTGELDVRKWFESKERPGEPVSMDEYFADIFDNSVPGLPEAAKKEGLSPLEYMRRYGAFEVPYAGQERYEQGGWKTPSKKLEIYSSTLAEWDRVEEAFPGYIRSQVHWRELDEEAGEMTLLPTFRLPTLIHTRSGNAKWLQELSHTNPVWIHPQDAARIGLGTGDLVRVATRIGYFVARTWVTEGIHPGVVACSHHVGRWRMFREVGGQKACSSLVDVQRDGTTFLFRQKEPAGSYDSADPDTNNVWWKEVGVNQNLTFPVQPDPESGMHCWHQKVVVTQAQPGDRYGDVQVDTRKSAEVYREWKGKTKPAPGPGGLRRPLWLNRPLRPAEDAFFLS
ncbi:MAG: molybdopterin-dependent oxidoreductase [Planctomycetota bacterium]